MGWRNFANFIISLFIIYVTFTFFPIIFKIFNNCFILCGVLWIAKWLMSITREYYFWERVPSVNKAIVITGCDTGIGHDLAKAMDKLGYQVFAGCLDSNSPGAKDLESMSSEKLKVMDMDVTSDESVASALKFVEMNLGNNALWALVNNAGISQVGEIDWAPLEEFSKVYEVNTLGMVRVTKAFLPLLQKSKGRIINNTSICSEFASPLFVGYCMSKSAAGSFTSGLRSELHQWEVRVIEIKPFFFKTPMTDANAINKTIDRIWENVLPEKKEKYGEDYIEALKKTVITRMRNFCWTNINEITNCIEDAIISEDPLSTYFPCYFPHKIVLGIALRSPFTIIDKVGRYLAYCTLPAELKQLRKFTN